MGLKCYENKDCPKFSKEWYGQNLNNFLENPNNSLSVLYLGHNFIGSILKSYVNHFKNLTVISNSPGFSIHDSISGRSDDDFDLIIVDSDNIRDVESEYYKKLACSISQVFKKRVSILFRCGERHKLWSTYLSKITEFSVKMENKHSTVFPFLGEFHYMHSVLQNLDKEGVEDFEYCCHFLEMYAESNNLRVLFIGPYLYEYPGYLNTELDFVDKIEVTYRSGKTKTTEELCSEVNDLNGQYDLIVYSTPYGYAEHDRNFSEFLQHKAFEISRVNNKRVSIGEFYYSNEPGGYTFDKAGFSSCFDMDFGYYPLIKAPKESEYFISIIFLQHLIQCQTFQQHLIQCQASQQHEKSSVFTKSLGKQ